MSIQAQGPAPLATTAVMVNLTVRPGISREQVMATLPAEIRQTVRVYLSGKIRDWYSRTDGRGAIFMLDCEDAAEAEAIMADLPLARQNLVDHEYVEIGPLFPMALLISQ